MPKSNWKEVVREGFKNGYIRLPLQIAKTFLPTDAIILGGLFTHYSMKVGMGEVDESGWVRLTERALMNYGPKLSIGSLRDKLTEMQSQGYLERKKKGIPGKRYYRLTMKAYEATSAKSEVPTSAKFEVGTSAKSEVRNFASSGGKRRAIAYSSKVRGDSYIPPTSGSRSTFGTTTTEGIQSTTTSVVWEELSSLLEEAVARVRKINSQSKLSTWPKTFRLLCTRDGHDPKKVRQILKWYKRELKQGGDLITNGNPLFLPIAYSAKKFREKFDQLEGAMYRQRHKVDADEAPKIQVKQVVVGRRKRAPRDY
jgi:hypothetical protein